MNKALKIQILAMCLEQETKLNLADILLEDVQAFIEGVLRQTHRKEAHVISLDEEQEAALLLDRIRSYL